MSSISRFQFEQMLARLARPGAPDTTPTSDEPESKLHRQIMDYCDNQWPRWKYVHSHFGKRTLNASGVPDFIIALPACRTLYVEAKRPGEKLSPAQRDWSAEMAKLGHTVHVVHDLKEFLALTKPVWVGHVVANPPPTPKPYANKKEN